MSTEPAASPRGRPLPCQPARRARGRVLLLASLAAAAVCALAAPAVAGAAAPLSWTPAPGALPGPATPTGVSCVSESLCVVVTAQGHVLETGEPAAAAPHWQQVASDTEMSAVSCPSAALCVAVDRAGRALVSTDPAASWSAPRQIDEAPLAGVSCASASACVAVDESGRLLWSTNPSSASGWSAPGAPAGTHAPLRAVSCGTPAVCVAVGASGETLATSSGPAGPWHLAEAEAARTLTAVSCTAGGTCVALDGAGTILASADPAAAAPTWNATAVAPGGSGTGISCADAGFCVALEGGEYSLASDNATAAVPVWSAAPAGFAPRALSCLPNGFCGAVDGGGRWLTARPPAPGVQPAPPAEVSEAGAVLAGAVNPNDASLGCQFEYGTSNAYGTTVPCSAPAPSSAFATVTAAIGGLQPNTTYHYRLVVFDEGRVVPGPDVAFTTATSSSVAIVHPHPSIGGTPAVGQTLTCFTGVAPGAARVSYEWLRDQVAVAGEEGSRYTVRGQDSGRHLQCRVTATDGGGSATATSSFVTVPLGGVPAAAGETAVGHPRVRGGTVSIPLACSPRAAGACNITLRLTLVETLSGRHIVAIAARARHLHAAGLRQRTVTLAAARVLVGAGARRTVILALGRSARRLLAAHHRLPAQLAVSGTVIGVLEAPLYQQVLQLGGPAHAAGHRTRGAGR